ncbi:hypothetical protein AAVH_26127, partial [Aphelenchoides avenae]
MKQNARQKKWRSGKEQTLQETKAAKEVLSARVQKQIKAINRLRRELDTLKASNAKLEDTVKEKDETIETLQGTMKEKNETIEKLETQ